MFPNLKTCVFNRLNFSYNPTGNQINKKWSGRCGCIDDLVFFIVKNKNKKHIIVQLLFIHIETWQSWRVGYDRILCSMWEQWCTSSDSLSMETVRIFHLVDHRRSAVKCCVSNGKRNTGEREVQNQAAFSAPRSWPVTTWSGCEPSYRNRWTDHSNLMLVCVCVKYLLHQCLTFVFNQVQQLREEKQIKLLFLNE